MHEETMDLRITIYEFHSDGREVVRGMLPTLTQRLDSAMLKGRSALYDPAWRGANGFIVTDGQGSEVGRWTERLKRDQAPA